MATINAALAAVERHLGFPRSRSRTVARRLQEADLLPSGAPGVAPEIDASGLVSLVIALAADTTLHNAPRAVATYRALTPAGTSLDGAPSSIIRTAGDAIEILADIALHGDADLYRRDRIEIVSNWPEVALHNAATGQVSRFRAVGADADHWGEGGHRKSTTINAAAFIDCVRDLFSKE